MKKRGAAAWWEVFKTIFRIFSIYPLLKTLFVPYRREFLGKADGASLFETVVFGFLVRVIGAVARLSLIAIGLIILAGISLLLPVFFIMDLAVDTESLKRRKAFGRDLSFRWTPQLRRHARDISLDNAAPLVGREDVISRLEQVLARGGQDNALIVGEPGVGRATIIAHFAQKVSWGQTLEPLQYKHVFKLSLEGMSPEKVKALLSEARSAGNVIVVLDDLHQYEHLFSVIAPFAEASDIQIVGVTDVEHFHSVIKNHAEILKSFEKIEVREPTDEETENLIAGTLDAHKVAYSPEVPKEIVRLTNQLVTHVPQPEKSLDIIEELLARKPKSINLEDVRKLMSSKTGVPVGEVSENERKVLLNLEEELNKRVIGQLEAVKELSDALRRGRSGVSGGVRPIGSFLFLGPTGVGKTHTAKELSNIYYDGHGSMASFDMTEFSQDDTTDEFSERLVITIEQNPFTLLLFDEIEKASKRILNLFLQILDEGRISDPQGREARFQNAFIICTSNAHSDKLAAEPNIAKDQFIEGVIKDRILAPEFLNRFDGLFLYRPLSKENSQSIAKLLLDDFASRIKEDKGISIVYPADASKLLGEVAYNSVFGGRSIRRALEQTVGNYIANEILREGTASGATLTIPSEILSAK